MKMYLKCKAQGITFVKSQYGIYGLMSTEFTTFILLKTVKSGGVIGLLV